MSVAGDAYGRISESLRRLRTVHYDDMGPVGSDVRRLYASGKQNLLTARTDEATGEIIVVVNARFAAVMLGRQFVRVNLAESRCLGEMARLLHLRLSVMVRPDSALTVPTDKLCLWAYGDEAASVRERQDRRKEVRHGVAELGSLAGWAVAENRRRLMVSIVRQQNPVGTAGECKPSGGAPFTSAASGVEVLPSLC